MHPRDWLELALTIVCGSLALVVGAVLAELLRVLANRARRERQIERIRVYGWRQVIRKALTGDPQSELELQPRRRHA